MLSPEAREVAQAARDLISDHHRWTRDSYARDSRGVPVSIHSPRAARWCATGAIERCARDRLLSASIEHELETALERMVGIMLPSTVFDDTATNIEYVNDTIGRAAVLVVFDKMLADETVGH